MSLSPDFAQLASKLGLRCDGFELEAQALWAKLETLSSEDPLQYQQFISQAMTVNKDDNSESKSFRPCTGFCMKTHCAGGFLDKKVIDCDNREVSCYLNFCHHSVVDPATIGADKSIAQFPRDIDLGKDIEIPMVVGVFREFITDAEKCMAIDIVFHHDVIIACDQDSFKASVIKLAVKAVLEDKGVQLVLKYPKVLLAKLYMGGLGDAGGTPVRFVVDSGFKQTQDISVGTLASSINAISDEAKCETLNIIIPGQAILKTKVNRSIIEVLPNAVSKTTHFKVDSHMPETVIIETKV